MDTVPAMTHGCFAAYNEAVPVMKQCTHAVFTMILCMAECNDTPHPVLYECIVPVIIRM